MMAGYSPEDSGSGGRACYCATAGSGDTHSSASVV